MEEQKLPVIIGKDVTEASEEELAELAETLKTGHYRIRKLTPRECGRLMGVPDADIDRILEVNSNTQAYKQFGNSIVVPVLMGLFSQLNISGTKAWNDMTVDEIEEMIKSCQ